MGFLHLSDDCPAAAVVGLAGIAGTASVDAAVHQGIPAGTAFGGCIGPGIVLVVGIVAVVAVVGTGVGAGWAAAEG